MPDPVLLLGLAEGVEVEHGLPGGLGLAVLVERRPPPEPALVLGVLPEVVVVGPDLATIAGSSRRSRGSSRMPLLERPELRRTRPARPCSRRSARGPRRAPCRRSRPRARGAGHPARPPSPSQPSVRPVRKATIPVSPSMIPSVGFGGGARSDGPPSPGSSRRGEGRLEPIRWPMSKPGYPSGMSGDDSSLMSGLAVDDLVRLSRIRIGRGPNAHVQGIIGEIGPSRNPARAGYGGIGLTILRP